MGCRRPWEEEGVEAHPRPWQGGRVGVLRQGRRGAGWAWEEGGWEGEG